MRWISSAARFVIAVSVVGFASLLIGQSAPPAPTAQSGTASPALTSAPAEKPLLILIDPAHGGNDAGALLTPTVAEKEITLNLARRLKQELNARGIQAQLIRDSDATLSADQRATVANTSDPALYISLHASSLGGGMRVFTAILPVAGDSKGPFISWNSAQSIALDRSKAIQAQLVTAIQQTRFPVRALVAPLRPLNNIKAPAIAIEISPSTTDASQVASIGYQQMICAALANALGSLMPAMRANAGARP